jgi:hypothetical protein
VIWDKDAVAELSEIVDVAPPLVEPGVEFHQPFAPTVPPFEVILRVCEL